VAPSRTRLGHRGSRVVRGRRDRCGAGPGGF
jgi:hypothetical protein